MSLEGNLTAFGLSEILQLIAVQQKSGMLSIRSQDRSKVLFFRGGQIISTRDRRRKTRDPLKDYLTRYGILSRDDLIRLMQISAQSKIDLADIIVSEEFLLEEEINKHFRNHIQEEVHELLMWEQCSYKFIPGNDIISGIKSLGEYSIEGMLMESMRRIDEFPQMLAELPDLSTQIFKNGEPEEDQKLSTNETAILGLIGEGRTISYLIARAKIPKFETYEALKHLKEKGLVTVLVEKGEEEQEEVRSAPKIAKSRRPRNVLPVMLAVAMFGASLFWGVRTVVPQARSIAVEGSQPLGEGSINRNQIENRLRWKLEAYRAKNGSYPSMLTSLKRSGLATSAFLDTVERHSFRYHLTAGGARYTLL